MSKKNQISLVNVSGYVIETITRVKHFKTAVPEDLSNDENQMLEIAQERLNLPSNEKGNSLMQGEIPVLTFHRFHTKSLPTKIDSLLKDSEKSFNLQSKVIIDNENNKREVMLTDITPIDLKQTDIDYFEKKNERKMVKEIARKMRKEIEETLEPNEKDEQLVKEIIKHKESAEKAKKEKGKQ